MHDSFCIVCEELIVEYLESRLEALGSGGASIRLEDSTPLVISNSHDNDDDDDDVGTTPQKRIVIKIGSLSQSFPHDRSGLASAREFLNAFIVS